MTLLCLTVALGLLAGGRATVLLPNYVHPACDSPEAGAAALAAQDFINTQHNHVYKYALNRVEDIKILQQPGADDLYIMEVDLLETNCHIQDPTPLANCTVRPKIQTAVEGDCDVILKNVGGAMFVQAFKCKTEESTEDICLGCATLLPLNDTIGLDFVKASLVTLNNNTVNASFAVAEVGRMSSQIVIGGPMYAAEFLIVEANCTGDHCVPSHDAMAQRGFCNAKGLNSGHAVDCKMFPSLIPVMDANNTVAHAPPAAPVFPVHTATLSAKHGLRHHKLTPLHNPAQTLLLSVSGESSESSEVVPVAPAVNVAQVVPVAPAVNVAQVVPMAPAVNVAQVVPVAPAVNVAQVVPVAPAVNVTQVVPVAPAVVADLSPAAADPTPAADLGAAAAAEPAPADDPSASDSISKTVSIEAPAVVVKREAPLADVAQDIPAIMPAVPINLVPMCPGRIRYF